MNEIKRDKDIIFEFFSKNRMIYALFGVFLAIYALFNPMFQIPVYFTTSYSIYNQYAFWIYGMYEHHSFYIILGQSIGWFDLNEPVMLLSITSTVIISILLLGTVLNAIYTLIRKREIVKRSSRLNLYFSAGIFFILHIYMYAFPLEHFFSHNYYTPDFFKLGPFLLILATVLILMGYTVEIKPFLWIFSFFIACSLIFFGVFNLIRTIFPAIIALICALAIILINFRVYRKERRVHTIENGNNLQ